MPIGEVHYLGRIKFAANREGYRYATVEPLIESNADGTQWLGSIHDALTRFPKRGLVHWHDAQPNAQKDTVWQFTTNERSTDHAEQWQVDRPEEPIEVVDLRGWTDETALRSAITGAGVSLTPAPLARRVLLWMSSGICVGPLLLKPGSTPGLWSVDAPVAHRDSARMPIWRPGPNDINVIDMDRRRWFLSPRLELGSSAGIQNWTSDAQVARSILGRLRKVDPDLWKAVAVTDNVFREYLDRIEVAEMGSADPVVERARADHLRGVRDAIKGDAALMVEAAEALLGTEAVRAEVNQKIESVVVEQVRARQSEIGQAVAAAAEQLRRAQEDLEVSRTQLAQVNDELQAKRCELELAVSSFDQEMKKKLEEIASRPEKLFVESAIFRAALAPLMRQTHVSRHNEADDAVPVRASVPTLEDTGIPILALGEHKAVRGALAAHAGSGSLSVHAILGLHAAFAAGVVPVVMGTRGYDLVRKYASAVAAGRLHWIPIPSSTMEPSDLLGRFDTASQRIVPSSSGLLDVVKDARQCGRLQVVVLEGFNRAPVDAYLEPILESAKANRAQDPVRAIPLASPAALQADDPYGELARFVWPANVLLACLPSDGNITLPLPQSMWRFFGVIDADDTDRPPILPVQPGGDAPVSEVPGSLWKEILPDGRGNGVRDAEKLIALHQTLSLPAHDLDDACRLFEVLRANGLPVADATSVAADAILIARFRGDAHTIENATRSVGVALPGWRIVLAQAQHLTS